MDGVPEPPRPVQRRRRAVRAVPVSVRILLATSNFPRWAGDSTTPFVLHLAQDLEAFGCRVDVIAPHAPGAASREVLDGINVMRFRYLWPQSQETVCYRGGALANLRRNPLNWLKLPALVAAEWAAIRRRLASGRYDLLHSHWVLPQGFVGGLAARQVATPHVLTVHGSDVFALRAGHWRQAKRVALRRADVITVNSSATASAVQDLCPELRPDIVPMGVSLDGTSDACARESIRRRHRRGAGPLVVFVGRLVWEKGADDAIRAMHRLRDRLPQAVALVIGDGPQRAELTALARHLGVMDRVRFLGWLSAREVSAHLAAADVFVGPSKRARNGGIEAQGLTFLEAMANGAPVVATRCGGVVDAVRHEETGLLVDEAAPDAIADAVVRLVGSPRLSRRLVECGHRLVRGRYSRAASAAAFRAVFERALGGSQSSSGGAEQPTEPAGVPI